MKAAFKRSVKSLEPYSHYILGISLGSRNTEGEALKAVVECLNQTNLREGIIDVSDTLARYTYQIEGMKLEEAYKHARKGGDDWIRQHQQTLARLKMPYRVIRWDHWLNDKRFKQYKEQYSIAANDNNQLRSAIQKDIDQFYKRRFNKIASDLPTESLELSKEFYGEEMAVMSIQFEDHPGAQIYPGKELECLKAARSGEIKNIPEGIQNAEFFRMSLSGFKNEL